MMKSFRDYLSQHNVHYTEPEIAENLDWIKRKIKQEVFMSTFGQQEGFKVLLTADPQVEKAAESVPQARALPKRPQNRGPAHRHSHSGPAIAWINPNFDQPVAQAFLPVSGLLTLTIP